MNCSLNTLESHEKTISNTQLDYFDTRKYEARGTLLLICRMVMQPSERLPAKLFSSAVASRPAGHRGSRIICQKMVLWFD